MDRLLGLIKISLLVALIFVLVVLFAPTLKGPFIVIHFATALRGWLFAQLTFLAVALAAAIVIGRTLAVISSRLCTTGSSGLSSPLAIAPLRC